MCGIVGVISKSPQGFFHEHVDIFEEMLYTDGIRGMDSTGVFSVSRKNQVSVLKQASHPGIFISTKSFRTFKEQGRQNADVIIGHNRKATSGAVTSKNAHPFQDKKIVLVHNGYIGNAKSIDDSVEVDSQAIITALDKEKDPVKGLQSLFGAWAVAWYNHETRKLFLAHNKERPLAIAESTAAFYVASEIDMLTWILNRHSLVYTAKEIPQDTLVEVSFRPFTIKESNVPIVTYTHRTSQQSGYDHTYLEDAFVSSKNDPDAEFDLEDVKPMTEKERAKERMNEIFRSIPSDEASLEERVIQISKRYPQKSYVLFNVRTHVPLPDDKMTIVTGVAWQAGKPSVEASITLKEGVDDDQLEACISPPLPMLAQVAGVARRNNSIKLLLESVRPASASVKDITGQELSHEEWNMLCKFKSCDECARAISPEQIDFTKVRKIGKYDYEVTCQECAIPQHGGQSGG